MAVSWANLGGLDLHLHADRGTRRLRASLEEQLRSAVHDGRLRPGNRLPPSRSLAADLGVSRNTVADVYAQLVAEGWLVARQGSGTRVSEERQPSHGPDAPPASEPRAPRYDLRAGFPDLTSFPRAEWLSAERGALAGAPDTALGYPDPAGALPLRVALAGYLGRARGVRVTPASIVVGAGFSGLLGALAVVLRQRGVRRIGVERFGHHTHRQLIVDAGLQPVPLEVDEQGARPEGLTGLGAVLLTSAHQFPTGRALSAERRTAFVRWADQAGSLLVEDDYDGEFRYDRRALGAVQALAPQSVAYVGTASKTLAPGLRLGWLVAPDRLRGDLIDLLGRRAGGGDALGQLTLARFVDSGRYDRHVRRMRLHYRARRQRLADAVDRCPGVRLEGMAAGLHATLWLPPGTDERAHVESARRHDLLVEGLSDFDAGGQTPPTGGLVIGFGTPAPRAYTSSLARLVATLRD